MRCVSLERFTVYFHRFFHLCFYIRTTFKSNLTCIFKKVFDPYFTWSGRPNLHEVSCLYSTTVVTLKFMNSSPCSPCCVVHIYTQKLSTIYDHRKSNGIWLINSDCVQSTKRLINMSIANLPEEIFVAILDFLPVASIQHLSATCHTLYKRIHQNDAYWSRKLRHQYRLNLNNNFLGKFSFDGLIEVIFHLYHQLLWMTH